MCVDNWMDVFTEYLVCTYCMYSHMCVYCIKKEASKLFPGCQRLKVEFVYYSVMMPMKNEQAINGIDSILRERFTDINACDLVFVLALCKHRWREINLNDISFSPKTKQKTEKKFLFCHYFTKSDTLIEDI